MRVGLGNLKGLAMKWTPGRATKGTGRGVSNACLTMGRPSVDYGCQWLGVNIEPCPVRIEPLQQYLT